MTREKVIHLTRRQICGCFICGVASPLMSFAAASEVKAQSYSGMLDYYANILESKIQDYRKRLRRNMTGREAELEADVRYRVIRNDRTNARAYDSDSGRSTIEIFVGLIRSAETFSEARVYTRLNEGSNAAGSYITYVINEIQDRLLQGNLRKEHGAIKLFYQFIGMSDGDYRRFRTNKTVNDHLDFEMNSSLMWILGHELGHHFGGHITSPQPLLEQRRQREEDADDTGFRLLRNTGYSALGTVPILLTFAVWDPEGHRFEQVRTHPSPLRRLKRNVQAGVREALAEPGFIEYLRQSGKEQAFHEEVRRDLQAIDNILNLP